MFLSYRSQGVYQRLSCAPFVVRFPCHALAGRIEISIRFIFDFFAVCGVWAITMAFTLRELRSALHECVLKPQPQQSSLTLRLWRADTLSCLSRSRRHGTCTVLEEARTRGRVTTDIDASFVGAVELLSNIHSTSQKTFQYYLTCFQLGCV
jgi:hypothetical protein